MDTPMYKHTYTLKSHGIHTYAYLHTYIQMYTYSKTHTCIPAHT